MADPLLKWLVLRLSTAILVVTLLRLNHLLNLHLLLYVDFAHVVITDGNCVLLLLLLVHAHLIHFVGELAGAVAVHERRDILAVSTLSQLTRLRREKIRVSILGILVWMLLRCSLHLILLVWELTALLTGSVRVIAQKDLALCRRLSSELRVILGIKLVKVVSLLLLQAAHSRRFILAPLHYLAHQLRLLRFIHVIYQGGHLRHDFLLLGHPLHICFFVRSRFLFAVARYSLL